MRTFSTLRDLGVLHRNPFLETCLERGASSKERKPIAGMGWDPEGGMCYEREKRGLRTAPASQAEKAVSPDQGRTEALEGSMKDAIDRTPVHLSLSRGDLGSERKHCIRMGDK